METQRYQIIPSCQQSLVSAVTNHNLIVPAVIAQKHLPTRHQNQPIALFIIHLPAK